MPRKKILLVDDSNTVILIERMLLSRSPYDLVIAIDGQDGVEKAIAEKPDLILMDVIMPRLNGFEACKRLRSHEQTAAIPIILVTTCGDEKSVQRGHAAGCSDYVTKPIDGGELLSKVRRCLGE